VGGILYVMATEHEFGPALRARITPLITGVGPVEAAIGLTEALTRNALTGTLPELVVSLGSAGSARLAPCGLYQARSVSFRDMDATALGFEPGVVPFLDQPATLPLGPLLADIPTATLSSGGDIVSGAAYAGIAEDMVDMETYALKRTCQRFGVPLIGLRGISDGDAELGALADWTRYLDVIDARLASAVDRIEADFAAGLLSA
jgi:adenosylhomocysteine nucleosidase